MANHPEMPMYVHATADLHLVTPKNSIKRPSSPRRKSKKTTKWLKKKVYLRQMWKYFWHVYDNKKKYYLAGFPKYHRAPKGTYVKYFFEFLVCTSKYLVFTSSVSWFMISSGTFRILVYIPLYGHSPLRRASS